MKSLAHWTFISFWQGGIGASSGYLNWFGMMISVIPTRYRVGDIGSVQMTS